MYEQITIIGRLGRDPEMRFTPAGQPVTSFSVATDRQFIDAQEQKVKITTWFRVQVWSRQAEACNNYLTKGKLVMVQGILQCDPKTGGPRTWEGKDGLMHTSFEINASTVKFLSPKDEGLDSMTKEEIQTEGEGVDDGIPF